MSSQKELKEIRDNLTNTFCVFSTDSSVSRFVTEKMKRHYFTYDYYTEARCEKVYGEAIEYLEDYVNSKFNEIATKIKKYKKAIEAQQKSQPFSDGSLTNVAIGAGIGAGVALILSAPVALFTAAAVVFANMLNSGEKKKALIKRIREAADELNNEAIEKLGTALDELIIPEKPKKEEQVSKQDDSYLLEELDELFAPKKEVIENTKESSFEIKDNTLFIFDYDGTVFDTDKLREKRKRRNVGSKEISEIKYVEGFEELFLNEESPLFLGKFKVLGITSSYSDYHNALLNSHDSFSSKLTYKTIQTSAKLSALTKFLSEHKNEFSDIIAFGDDEKDALIYSRLNLKYYIINKYYGYDAKVEEILQKIYAVQLDNFRNHYLHDVKAAEKTTYNIYHFDDIVIYYQNYLDTYRIDYKTGIEKGSNNAPSQGNIEPRRVYKAKNELGKTHKNEYILNHLEELAKEFDDLPIDKNSILVCIPGHNELTFDYNKPMYQLIKRIAERHNIKLPPDGVLYRKKEVEESKEGNRNIDVHLESIGVTPEGKKAIRGKNVYLFDDIVTTGSTMIASCVLLYHFNAGHIICTCVARTCGDGKCAPVEIK